MSSVGSLRNSKGEDLFPRDKGSPQQETDHKGNNYLLVLYLVLQNKADDGLLANVKAEKIPQPTEAQDRLAGRILQINDDLQHFSPDVKGIEQRVAAFENEYPQQISQFPIEFKRVLYFGAKYLRQKLEEAKKSIAGHDPTQTYLEKTYGGIP